jgi:hypothetical protein
MKPDDGCFLQPKHVGFCFFFLKCCVETDCVVVAYYINTTGTIHIKVKITTLYTIIQFVSHR